MPSYCLRNKTGAAEAYYVFAIDCWDAREQIATTLHIDAHNKALYQCLVHAGSKLPLNRILHSSGEWTDVPAPLCLRDDPDERDGLKP